MGVHRSDGGGSRSGSGSHKAIKSAERMAAQEESQQLALQAMMNDLALQNGTNQGAFQDFYIDSAPKSPSKSPMRSPPQELQVGVNPETGELFYAIPPPESDLESSAQPGTITHQRQLVETTDTDGNVTSMEYYTKQQVFVDTEGEVYETDTETLTMTGPAQQSRQAPQPQRTSKSYKRAPSRDSRRGSSCLKPFSLTNQSLIEQSDENVDQPYIRYPSSARDRYMATDSPPDMTRLVARDEWPEPKMYVSRPNAPSCQNYRGRKRGRVIKERALHALDEDFERYGITPNVKRGPYQNFGRDLYQDKRKKKAQVSKPRKILQDAAHTCSIEVDDDGCLNMVLLSDDLAHTDLRFGKQNILFMPETRLMQGDTYSVPKKRKPRKYQVGMKAHAPTQCQTQSIHNVGFDRGLDRRDTWLAAEGVYKDPCGKRAQTALVLGLDSDHHLLDRDRRDTWWAAEGVYKDPCGKRAQTALVLGLDSDHHLLDRVAKVKRQSVKSQPGAGHELRAGKQVYVTPAHETDEIMFGPWNARRAYQQRADSSSSEDEVSIYDQELFDKACLTEEEWRSKLTKEASRKHKTLIYGTPSQIEGGRHSGLEVEYPGGQKEYTKSRSQIEMKQFYIPADMQGYAVGEYDRVPEQQYIGRLSNGSRASARPR